MACSLVGPLPDPGEHWLSRGSLAAVLQSLLTAELATARGRRGVPPPVPAIVAWEEEQRIGDGVLACDSIEAMWLQAAVNEMFHLHEVDAVDALSSDQRFGAWLDVVEAAWRRGVSRITFSTSGSTGLPKRCTHGFSDLHTEVQHLVGLFGNCRRIVAATPAHHIYGFILTALLPDALGHDVLRASGFGAGRLAAELQDGDLIVTFPEKWAWIERSLPAFPPGVAGVVSTAPCPAGLVEALVAKGLSAMTDIYGSSETAGVATRRLPGEDRYALMPHWRFADDHDVLVRTDRRSHVPTDRLVVGADGRFSLAGRIDGAVQVGGVNVWPSTVADRLRSVAGVADAIVRLMRPEEGARLKAFVVPTGGVAVGDLIGYLQSWIDLHLSAPQRPKDITFGQNLPTSAMGKAADW